MEIVQLVQRVRVGAKVDLNVHLVDSTEGSSILCNVILVHKMKFLPSTACLKHGSLAPYLTITRLGFVS